jgi:hypothetical protein
MVGSQARHHDAGRVPQRHPGKHSAPTRRPHEAGAAFNFTVSQRRGTGTSRPRGPFGIPRWAARPCRSGPAPQPRTAGAVLRCQPLPGGGLPLAHASVSGRPRPPSSMRGPRSSAARLARRVWCAPARARLPLWRRDPGGLCRGFGLVRALCAGSEGAPALLRLPPATAPTHHYPAKNLFILSKKGSPRVWNNLPEPHEGRKIWFFVWKCRIWREEDCMGSHHVGVKAKTGDPCPAWHRRRHG